MALPRAPYELVVSFDLDGTLVRSPAGTAFRSVAARLGEDAWPAVLAEHERLLRSGDLTAYDWSALAGREAARRGHRFDGDLVTPLRNAIAERGIRLMHDRTAEHLGELRAAGARVVVLTNGRREFQEPVLEAAGLLTAIDELVASDDVGAMKPAAAMFAAARAGAGLHVHVGDRLDHDIAGASAAGATAVLLRPDAPVEPSALPAYLDALCTAEGGLRPVRPDAVLRDLADVVAFALSR